MKLSKYVSEKVFQPRLRDSDILVVYDPENLYRETCLSISSEECKVVDASESSIESRELAISTLQLLRQPDSSIVQMLVYVPATAPTTDEDSQGDPFAIYGKIGSVFPLGDGDEYQSICLVARSDHQTQVRELFRENTCPSFDVIDAIGGGGGWPQLQAALGVESARELILALLAPTEDQKAELKSSENWVTEAKELFSSVINLKLVTRGKTWNSISDELWRYVLMSEFAFDLPEELPESLSEVPVASLDAKPVIEHICGDLRSDRRTQDTYIERAEYVERELNLPACCADVKNLGVLDTFAFEERSFFRSAVAALKDDNVDEVRQILNQHSTSVWIGKGESQSQWQLLRVALQLIEACDDADRQLAEHVKSQQSLIDHYTSSLRGVDRLQREFEQAAPDWLIGSDSLDEIVTVTRATYRDLTNRVQGFFTKHLEKSGWPVEGMLSNTQVFDKHVAKHLQTSGQRVAYLLVDALRYELGVALEQELREEGQVELIASCAQLPSVTPVGMASLLPAAETSLTIESAKDQLVVQYNGDKLNTVSHRMAVFKAIYNERFTEVKLDALIKQRAKFDSTVELVVVRTNDIDERFEISLEAGLSDVSNQLRRLRVAVHKLGEFGFDRVVIATDHGFYINAHAGPGDVVSKPDSGTWKNLHSRCLLGNGAEDVSNFVVTASDVGIKGSYNQFACPRSLSAYSEGQSYFHGGASLQECLVPVITVKFKESKENIEPEKYQVGLTYKANKITTRVPVIDVQIGQVDMFASGELEILIEAQDSDGKVVGEAKPGGLVNPATGTIRLATGKDARITMKMEEDFEGKFIIKALDPVTLALYGKLNLKTDYL